MTLSWNRGYVTNWSMTERSPCYVYKARDIAEIRHALTTAHTSGLPVIPRGAGHSYTDAALNTNGIIIDVTGMRHILSWNPEQGIMEVEPGVSLRDIVRVSLADQWWPAVTPSTPDATIAGCVAMNVNGKNAWKCGSFGEHLLSLTVLLATGQTLTLSPKGDAQLFQAFVGSAGLLGIIISVTLQLQRIPSTSVDMFVRSATSLSEILAIFQEEQSADFLEAWVDGFQASLQTLLDYPFQLIPLGAYWNRLEPEPGTFYPDELDGQIDAAERAGKHIILCVGPLKTFGYPEFFVPAHHLSRPFPERILIKPSAYPSLLTAATEFITRLVERYKHRKGIVAWQLEHEAVDPLGMEHSWRLDVSFIEKEVEALRKADPSRPVMMNGFLPTSSIVRLSQWWRTLDQGDSLTVAQHLADIVGIDYYLRHALMTVGARTVYLDGGKHPWQQWRRKQLSSWARTHGQKLMITEGQAEPWKTVTTPPNPPGRGMYSCLPEHVIINYNTCLRWSRRENPLYAYLFWGAEYWLLRKQYADPSYLRAFARILEHA